MTTTMFTEEEQQILAGLYARRDELLKLREYHQKGSEALSRLFENEDFKYVIQELYLSERPKTIAFELSNTTQPNMIDKLHKDIYAVGAFRNFLGDTANKLNFVERELHATEEEIKYALSSNTGDVDE